MLLIGVATVVGALAALAFQILSARALGPSEFGLLAAFLAILNVAAIASAALQNSVAVRTAEQLAAPTVAAADKAGRRVSDATILGVGAALVVALLTPALARSLDTDSVIVLLAALAIPLSFWLAEDVGVLQGSGNAFGAVAWTTVSLIARVLLVLVSMWVGFGIGGVLGSVLVATALALVGARMTTRRMPHPRASVFNPSGLTVLALSASMAWLINADVVMVRAGAPGDVAGNFASAAILVKASFMLPSTLSLYLLPRFVRNRHNVSLVRTGEMLTIGITAASGLLLTLVFWVAGDFIANLVYGPGFEDTGTFLVPLSLVYLPWMVAQAVLIRLTADASRPAAVTVLVAIAVQAVGFTLALPDVTTLMWIQAAVGAAVLGAFLLLVRRANTTTPPLQERTLT
ncbi:hypothetical protein Cch01nite_08990 [Cellulomonas chitinilytica]|uniref:Polysaccharide biosynthesis protein n=1 Tax=Cellulomonas chitinilytica TaxID=398759 RepID=A0A919P0U8_9CELL|nr:hypothetical protein Cch01nite_08990 [Cellulomonas chitinilytica]